MHYFWPSVSTCSWDDMDRKQTNMKCLFHLSLPFITVSDPKSNTCIWGWTTKDWCGLDYPRVKLPLRNLFRSEKEEKKERGRRGKNIWRWDTSPVHLQHDDSDKPYFKKKQLRGSQSHCKYVEKSWPEGLGLSQQGTHQRICGSFSWGKLLWRIRTKFD